MVLISFSVTKLRAVVLAICAFAAFILLVPMRSTHKIIEQDVFSTKTVFQYIRPTLPPSNKKQPDPIRWLAENADNKYAVSSQFVPQIPGMFGHGRPRAALISLVRNSELEGMMQSMRQLEYRWNSKYQVKAITRTTWRKLTLIVPLGFLQR